MMRSGRVRMCLLWFTVCWILAGFLATPPVVADADAHAHSTAAAWTTAGPERVLVGLYGDESAAELDTMRSALGGQSYRVVSGGATAVIEVPTAVDTAHVASVLTRGGFSPRYVERDLPVYATSGGIPNDPEFSAQYGLQDLQPGGTHALGAWSRTDGDPSIVVGVIDSGVDLDHPDLVESLWVNPGGIGDCPGGTHGFNWLATSELEFCYPYDGHGHGTHVGGIIGASANNGIGVAGIAPQTTILPIKVLDHTGTGSLAAVVYGIDTTSVLRRDHAVDIRVVNLSLTLGTGNYSAAVRDSIKFANDNGILVVTAAGNGNELGVGQDMTMPSRREYPCATPLADPTVTGLVCVAATNSVDALGGFSNYGASAVDLAAPGVDIVSTWLGNGYAGLDGTSMAAPMVAGAAALFAAADPSLSLSALKQRVMKAVDPIPALAGKVRTGGRLNVCKGIADGQLPLTASVRQHDGGAVVSWRASCTDVFPVTGYDVAGAGPSSGPLGSDVNSWSIDDLTNNQRYSVTVTAQLTGGTTASVTRPFQPLGGGYVLDAWGGLHRFGIGNQAVSPHSTGGPYWVGWDIARAAALLPDGTGGYVLDAWGGLHGFSVGPGPLPPPPRNGPYWPGWDITRGLSFSPDGAGGYVLDGYGGLHRFNLPGSPLPAPASGAPYWAGWDIARNAGVGVSADAQIYGYIGDGWGGIHGFSVTGPAPSASGGPYWPGWTISHGPSIVPAATSKGGYIVDGFGGLHPFMVGAGPAPPTPHSGPYWSGQDIARGAAM